MIAALAAFGAVTIIAVLAIWNLYETMKEAAAARADAEHAVKERERSERMAREMLRERTVEEIARDLDAGDY